MPGDLHGALQSFGRVLIKSRQLIQGTQVSLRVGLQMRCCLIDRQAQTDGGQDMLEHLPPRRVIQHVAGGDQRQAPAPRPVKQLLQAASIIGALMQRSQEISALAKTSGEVAPGSRVESTVRRLLASGRRHAREPLGSLLAHILPAQPALSLGRSTAPQR